LYRQGEQPFQDHAGLVDAVVGPSKVQGIMCGAHPMTGVRRVRFPRGAISARNWALIMLGSCAFALLGFGMMSSAVTGRGLERPAWSTHALGLLCLLFFGLAALVAAQGFAIGMRILPVLAVRCNGGSVRVICWNPFRGRRVARFNHGQRVPLAVHYGETQVNRRRPRLYVTLTLGGDGNRVSLFHQVRTSDTDWQAWATELAGDDFFVDVIVDHE